MMYILSGKIAMVKLRKWKSTRYTSTIPIPWSWDAQTQGSGISGPDRYSESWFSLRIIADVCCLKDQVPKWGSGKMTGFRNFRHKNSEARSRLDCKLRLAIWIWPDQRLVNATGDCTIFQKAVPVNSHMRGYHATIFLCLPGGGVLSVGFVGATWPLTHDPVVLSRLIRIHWTLMAIIHFLIEIFYPVIGYRQKTYNQRRGKLD